MKMKIITKTLSMATALLGLAAVSRAQDPLPPSGTMGLLGQTYAGLNYTFVDLDKSPTNADSFGFEYNQAMNTGLDAILTYDWTQSGLVLGDRARQQTIAAALRAFSTSYSWGKPYVEAGVGYTRTRFAGAHDSSLVWDVGVGTEFQLAPKATVTPYIKYSDAPDLAGSGTWNFGAKGNYWVTSQWAVSVGVNYDDDHDAGYTVGTSFRF